MESLDRTGDGMGSPAVSWYQISPSDNTDLPVRPRALLIGVAGSLAVVGLDGSDEILPVPVGYNPLRPVRVKSTGTTATGIFGLY
jgi:hypothetical protein